LLQTFDAIAEAYDRWYDTPDGRAIFNAELIGLRPLCGGIQGRWLEVGVGTGRFAYGLGIAEGIDPSPPMLELAAGRGIKTYEGSAEALPFADESFNGVLLALTLCFLADPPKALAECRRILRPGGKLVLGMIPANSPWGKAYERKKAEGHPVYALAHFFEASEMVALVELAGLAYQAATSTLFWAPNESSEIVPRVEPGTVPGAGFLGLLFIKNLRGAEERERL